MSTIVTTMVSSLHNLLTYGSLTPSFLLLGLGAFVAEELIGYEGVPLEMNPWSLKHSQANIHW